MQQTRMVTIENEDYLTAKQSADFLGVSPTTFVKFQDEYHLKWKTRPGMGNRKFFRKKDLEPLLEFRSGSEDGESDKT